MKTAALAALAAALLLGGCLQLIRRPPAAVEPIGEHPRNWQPQSEETQAAPVEKPPKEKPAAVRPAHPQAKERGDKARRRARQVNEYALWCIENGMWEEARLHLERATARDSLASSFHNNLGIVYEQGGLLEEALSAYRRAAELAPHKESYAANLDRLESRQKRAAQGLDEDSLATGPAAPPPQPNGSGE